MEKVAQILQAVGYHAVLIWPLLPVDLHLIISALFPIYAGAHASLSRPSSAATPSKTNYRDDDEDEPEEQEQKMEAMSPADAIWLPLTAGGTLAGLYFLLKWLEDPEILNKTLNWYFSVFGVVALARLITDTLSTAASYVFPIVYSSDGHVWEIDAKKRKATTKSSSLGSRNSPLPGFLSNIPLPDVAKDLMWTLRNLPSRKLRIRAAIRGMVYADVKIGPLGILGFLIALAAQGYFNLVGKPWWLTNILGFSFAYNALQLISPTTSWTGTLILCALFVYDIYFVFFTPLMVTVATQLDIPAKLLFPRPSRPNEDPATQTLSMLGLGDVVLPGMMIGFALRFDLYLFYLRRQTWGDVKEPESSDDEIDSQSSRKQGENHVMKKDKWYPANGGWGERFWTSRKAIITSERFRGTIFPKTYFRASLVGYVAGMLVTLSVMQVFGHAQPALLYLVPGVLGAFWGTALMKGDIKAMWAYSELDEAEEESKKRKEESSGWKWSDWKSILGVSKSVKKPKEPSAPEDNAADGLASESSDTDSDSGRADQAGKGLRRHRESELIFLSINLPSISHDLPIVPGCSCSQCIRHGDA